MLTARRMTPLLIVLLAGWLAPCPVSAQFMFDKRPSIRLGDELRVDLRARFQGDFRNFSPIVENDERTFDLNRARIGVEGKFLRHIDYQVEREFRDHFG